MVKRKKVKQLSTHGFYLGMDPNFFDGDGYN